MNKCYFNAWLTWKWSTKYCWVTSINQNINDLDGQPKTNVVQPIWRICFHNGFMSEGIYFLVDRNTKIHFTQFYFFGNFFFHLFDGQRRKLPCRLSLAIADLPELVHEGFRPKRCRMHRHVSWKEKQKSVLTKKPHWTNNPSPPQKIYITNYYYSLYYERSVSIVVHYIHHLAVSTWRKRVSTRNPIPSLDMPQMTKTGNSDYFSQHNSKPKYTSRNRHPTKIYPGYVACSPHSPA